jgi:hypothetical protein
MVFRLLGYKSRLEDMPSLNSSTHTSTYASAHTSTNTSTNTSTVFD